MRIFRALCLGLALLVTAASPAAAVVLQTASSINSSTCIQTLPRTPVIGNVLIAWFNAKSGDPSLAINTSKWTLITNGGSGTGQWIIAAYHYVVSGDTATNAAVTSSGFTNTACAVAEIGDVTGTWATDFEQSDAKYNQASGGGTVTTNTLTTTHAGDLAVMGAFVYQGTSIPTGFSGFNINNPISISGLDAGNYGGYRTAYQGYASNSSSVSTSYTTTGGSSLSGYITLVFNGAAGGSAIRASNVKTYDVLNAGTANQVSGSKLNTYDVLNAGTLNQISASKSVTYFVLKTVKPAGFFHSVPQ